ncbi:MAG: carboxyltransferase domain-containing protein, partial [Natronospirillum sp.]
MKLTAVSEDSVLMQFGDLISEALIPRIVTMERLIEEHLGDLVIDLVPSYTTLLCIYDVDRVDHREILRRLRVLSQDLDTHLNDAPSGKEITIPVWYDPEVGYDLETLAKDKGMTVPAVIATHTSKRYQVFAIGFNPG